MLLAPNFRRRRMWVMKSRRARPRACNPYSSNRRRSDIPTHDSLSVHTISRHILCACCTVRAPTCTHAYGHSASDCRNSDCYLGLDIHAHARATDLASRSCDHHSPEKDECTGAPRKTLVAAFLFDVYHHFDVTQSTCTMIINVFAEAAAHNFVLGFKSYLYAAAV